MELTRNSRHVFWKTSRHVAFRQAKRDAQIPVSL